MFIARLLEDSYQLQGLAAADVLPAWLHLDYLHPTFHTPWVAMAPSLLVILLSCALDFSQIVAVENCFCILGELLQIAAFVRLRWDRGAAPRDSL